MTRIMPPPLSCSDPVADLQAALVARTRARHRLIKLMQRMDEGAAPEALAAEYATRLSVFEEAQGAVEALVAQHSSP